MTIPMHAVKALYNEMTIHCLIEIDGYDQHDQYYQEVQVTGTHPEIGFLTIHQGQYHAHSVQCWDIDFGRPDVDPEDTELEPGLTVRDWKNANPEDPAGGAMLAFSAFAEKHSAEAFSFVREKARAVGIRPTKISCPLHEAPTADRSSMSEIK